MKIRHLLLALLAVLLVVPAATAAIAQTADQTLDVSVMAADIRSIQVESDIGLGVVTPGGSSGERYFGMQLTNTYSGTGFEVTVDGTDFVSYYWDDPCDENGCTRYFDGLYTLAKTNLFVQGGTLGWDPEPLTAYGSYLSATAPVTIIEATSAAYGALDLGGNPPFVRLDVPVGADLADYTTTLTYTIQAPTP